MCKTGLLFVFFFLICLLYSYSRLDWVPKWKPLEITVAGASVIFVNKNENEKDQQFVHENEN